MQIKLNGTTTFRNFRGKEWRPPQGDRPAEGNPVYAPVVEDIMKALTRFVVDRNDPRRHSLAMTIERMRKIMEWSYAMCPDSVSQGPITDTATQALVTKHLWFRAWAATGWILWTR